jgi:5-formyltetrahydrofolate cyclo-ligase
MLKDLMGLPAPSVDDPRTSSAQFDTWVVPCVGVDQLGYRLGAGKGFYDRTMAHREANGLSRPRLYGVAFTNNLIPMPIAEPHDLQLDAVLTERGWRDF